MEHIKITDLPVDASRIGLGTWAIGGWLWGGTEESDAISTIHAALDNGINVIDTAPVYGFGRSEELVGKALESGRREGAIIATKVGLDWRSGKILRNSTPARLRVELEDSLRRLKTEFQGDDLRKIDPKFQKPRLGHYLAAVDRLDAFARERYGKTVLALAVRWLLDRGKIIALWGARRPDQLAPVKEVMGWTLDGSA